MKVQPLPKRENNLFTPADFWPPSDPLCYLPTAFQREVELPLSWVRNTPFCPAMYLIWTNNWLIFQHWKMNHKAVCSLERKSERDIIYKYLTMLSKAAKDWQSRVKTKKPLSPIVQTWVYWMHLKHISVFLMHFLERVWKKKHHY